MNAQIAMVETERRCSVCRKVLVGLPRGATFCSDLCGQLAAGTLEQTCPACGRCEAAGGYDSWCGRPMTAADWYLAGRGRREHEVRLPVTPPADPPPEYRHAYQPGDGTGWPPAWGASSFQKGVRPLERGKEPREGSVVAPSTSSLSSDAA